MLYKIKKISLTELSSEEKAAFSSLLPIQYRCCLDGKEPSSISFAKIIAIGLMYRNKPVGIAVSANYEDLGFATLFSINIEEAHRDLARAVDMVKEIELEVKRQEATIITFFFRKGDLDSQFLESLLAVCEWSGPKAHTLRYFFDCYTFSPKWFQQELKLPKHYEIFPWKQLKKTEREQLEAQYEEGYYSESVYPFEGEETIEFSNSLGLRSKGRVIGWVVTHRIAPDTIKYSCLYIQPEFQFLGASGKLLAESIKLQQKSSKRWSVFEIFLDENNRSWFKFIQKRLAPYALETDLIFQSWKALNPDTFQWNSGQ